MGLVLYILTQIGVWLFFVIMLLVLIFDRQSLASTETVNFFVIFGLCVAALGLLALLASLLFRTEVERESGLWRY